MLDSLLRCASKMLCGCKWWQTHLNLRSSARAVRSKCALMERLLHERLTEGALRRNYADDDDCDCLAARRGLRTELRPLGLNGPYPYRLRLRGEPLLMAGRRRGVIQGQKVRNNLYNLKVRQVGVWHSLWLIEAAMRGCEEVRQRSGIKSFLSNDRRKGRCRRTQHRSARLIGRRDMTNRTDPCC